MRRPVAFIDRGPRTTTLAVRPGAATRSFDAMRGYA